MSFTAENRNLMIENIRGAARLIKINISPDRYENVFDLMNKIPVPNGDIIIDALAEREIYSYEDIYTIKWNSEFGIAIGVMLHNITLKYINKILKKTCMYYTNICTCPMSHHTGNECPGIHKCDDFIEKFRRDYERVSKE